MEEQMRLNPPKKITLWISIALAAVGALIYLFHGLKILTAALFSPIAVLLILAGYVLLVLGLFIKGL
jgi:hypothetical protein